MIPREYEGALNVQLADELRKRALDAKPKVIHRHDTLLASTGYRR